MILANQMHDEQVDTPPSETEDRSVPDALIREELDRMLASRHFRTSRRCKEFLQYVVKQKVRGNGGLLKERLIGVEIFRRKPDYPVGEDPVVRVLAGDVRHRLERYHADPECHSDIVIEIPLGSYAPVFTFRKDAKVSDPAAEKLPKGSHPEADLRSATTAVAAEPEESGPVDHPSGSASPVVERPAVPGTSEAASDIQLQRHGESDLGSVPEVPNRRRVFFQRTILFVALFLALSGVLGWWYSSRQSQTMSKFWLPVSASSKPVLLWLPKPMVYRPSDALFEKYEKAHPNAVVTREGRQDKYLPLEPGDTIAWGDMVPIQDAGPGTGGVIAAVNMGRLLTEQGIRFEIRFGPEANYAEMRDSPAVIVGAINSDWATQLTSESHFAFDESIAAPSIYETSGAKRRWTMEVNHGHKTRDYGLITRQLSGKSGQFVVQVAGISHFGTEAASEFLLEKGELERILRSESISLQKRNLQIIVSTDITNEHAGPPHVVAVDSW